nr:universal stress protein [Thermicanus aegyptius]
MRELFKKILVAYDGSGPSKKALDVALGLVKEEPGTELYLVHIVKYEPVPANVYGELAVAISQTNFQEAARKHGEEILQEAIDIASKEGLHGHSALIEGDPASSIIEYANEKKVDLIVMGNRGLSPFREFFLGSVSHRVTQMAETSVLIVK